MRALVLTTLLALAIPTVASAAPQYYIPPGNSGASQYVESVPTARGGTPASSIHRGGGTGGSRAGSGGAVSPATHAALLSQGSTGAQTAAFAEATGPNAGPARSITARSITPGASGHPIDAAVTPRSRSGGTVHAAHSGAGASGGGASGGGAAGAGSVGASSAATSVARSITGIGGHGATGLLPVALAVVVVAMGGIAVWRRRRSA